MMFSNISKSIFAVVAVTSAVLITTPSANAQDLDLKRCGNEPHIFHFGKQKNSCDQIAKFKDGGLRINPTHGPVFDGGLRDRAGGFNIPNPAGAKIAGR
jgi:hypothetical protein